MKFKLLPGLITLAFAAMTLPAGAAVVCDTCSYTGNPGSNLGLHNTTQQDNSTFGNSTTGADGNFSNTWVFSIAPAGASAVNAIFLPFDNISNFDVDLYAVTSSTCAANTPGDAGACSAVTLGAQLVDGVTPVEWASGFNFFSLNAGTYAFVVSGTISGLAVDQPASYTGNLQVRQNVPEPGSFALAGLALLGAGAAQRRKKA